MELLEGYVNRIIFQSEDNGYTVLELEVNKLLMECVGNLLGVTEGEYIRVEGEYVLHPTHGRQFKVQSYQVRPPEDVEKMEKYLGSGAIKGIGEALAARIVNAFGEETFRIIEEEPERLAEVKGISERKAREIALQMEEKRETRYGLMYLQQYGISYGLSVKLVNQYGKEIHKILEENPYRLAEEVQGIGFKIADEIAIKAGIQLNSDYRIRAGIFYILQLAANQGHTYLPYDKLVNNCLKILQIPGEDIDHHIMDMMVEKKLYITEKSGEKRVYASSYYYMEMNVAHMLQRLNHPYPIEEQQVERLALEIEDETGIVLEEHQRETLFQSAKQGILIITGGPGTGKTTTIKSILRYFEKQGMDMLLAAPTGRAAKRMTEATGFEAQTIHRMLGLTGGYEEGTNTRSERDEDNPLEADVIIIDEASMVDIYLMNSLLKAVLPGTRLILVGDVDQLPSVGPGCVLRDMIQSETLPVVKLGHVFRQAAQSDIIVNAHRINRGETLRLNNRLSKDFFFMEKEDAVLIQRTILALVMEKLPKYVGAESFDIQVLSPGRRGLLGVENLNILMQKYLNPPSEEKKERQVPGGVLREGDKVMQIKNNYQMEWEIVNRYNIPEETGLGIFNGDVGKILYIDDGTETVRVLFDDGKQVSYSYKQLDELELAYAMTVHKAQGSEYPAVVIPLVKGPLPLRTRNILYTAVTRAKKCVTLIGEKEVLEEMIANANENKRYSGLKECLCSCNMEKIKREEIFEKTNI